MIVGPRQVRHALRLCRQIFDAGGQTVVHVGKQVVSLVPSDVCHIHSQSCSHGSVTDVATAFLHLSQFSVRTCFQLRILCRDHQIAYEFRQSVIQNRVGCTWVYESTYLVVFVERKALVIKEHVITKDADAHYGQYVAQSPVRPIMPRALPPSSGVFPRAVSAT